MPVTGLDFGAQVSSWVQKSERRMEAVFKESTKRVVSLAQSRIPVDTGFARASVRASLESMPPADMGGRVEGSSYEYDSGQVLSVILQARLGQTIYVGWTANYAVYLEYGHSQQAPSGFVRISAMEWPRIVSEVTAELRAGGLGNG